MAVAIIRACSGDHPIRCVAVAAATEATAVPMAASVVKQNVEQETERPVGPPIMRRPARARTTSTAARQTVPVGAPDDAVVKVKSSFGYNARLGTAIAVVAIMAMLAFFVFHRSDTTIDRAGWFPDVRVGAWTCASSTIRWPQRG